MLWSSDDGGAEEGTIPIWVRDFGSGGFAGGGEGIRNGQSSFKGGVRKRKEEIQNINYTK